MSKRYWKGTTWIKVQVRITTSEPCETEEEAVEMIESGNFETDDNIMDEDLSDVEAPEELTAIEDKETA